MNYKFLIYPKGLSFYWLKNIKAVKSKMSSIAFLIALALSLYSRKGLIARMWKSHLRGESRVEFFF